MMETKNFNQVCIMKRIFSLFALASLAVLSLSCEKEIESPESGKAELYTYSFEAFDADADKSTFDGSKITWKEGDEVGYFVSDFSGNSVIGSDQTFKISTTEPVTGETLYAYVPYVDGNATATSVNITIPELQASDNLVMPAFGSATVAADGVVPIKLSNLGSIVAFKLYSATGAYSSEKVTSITMASTTNAICGTFTKDITASSALEISGYDKNAVTVSVNGDLTAASSKENATVVYAVIAPGTYDGNIVVTTDAATYTYPFSSQTFQRSHSKGLVLNFEKDGVREKLAYEKVTLPLQDWSGEYLLVAPDANMVLSAISTTSTKYGVGIEVEIVNDEIEATRENSAYKLTIAPASEGSSYVIKFGGDYLYWSTGNSLGLSDKESDNTRWTLSCSDGSVLIKNVADEAREIWWNNGSPRFACYTGKTADNSYFVTALFKLGCGGTPVPPATKYTITVPDNLTGGTVTSDKYEAEAGETVTITASPESGYLISELTANVEGEVRNGRELSFSMPEADVTISASFVIDNSKVAVFTIDSATSVNKSGDCAGLSATFNNSYTSNKQQLTNGNTMTLTISGLGGKTITGLTLSMHSNKSAGAGYLSVLAGSSLIGSIGSSNSGVAFNDSAWNKAWSTDYVDINTEINEYTFQSGENLVITIGATVNSLFCESFTIKYTDSGESGDDVTLSSIAIKTAPTKVSYTAGEKFDPTGLVITKTMSDESTEDVAYADHASDFTFKPSLSTALTTGDTSVTITYGGKTTTCDITVNAASVTEYASLADLIATEGTPTSSGKQVKVTLTEEIIKSIYVSKSSGNRIGVFVSVGDNDIELYHSDVPEEWVNGGTISGTVEGSWKLFNSTWEIEMTSDWTGIEYSAPAAVAVTGVSIDETATVEVGKTVTLTAIVTPANATNKNVAWASSDDKVATVADGVVTGVAEGTADITVTTVDGRKTATCVVTVTAGGQGGGNNKTCLDMTTKEYGTSAYNTSLKYGDWTIVNGANNNKGWAYFKMGGKSATISSSNPCYIYNTIAITHSVKKITVHLPEGSLSKSGMSVKSWGVYVYSDKEMTTQVDYVAGGTITKTEGSFDFTPSAGKTWNANYYYKISWDLANTTSTNGIVNVDKITLHENN